MGVWRKQSLVNIVVRVTNPTTPTYQQVEAVEKEINERIGYPLGLNFKLQVERINVSIVNGDEIVNNNNNNTVDPDLLDSDLDLMKESLDQLVPLTDEEPAGIRPTTTEINHQDQKIKPRTAPVRKPETTSDGAFELEMIDEEQEVSMDEKHLTDTPSPGTEVRCNSDQRLLRKRISPQLSRPCSPPSTQCPRPTSMRSR